nr:MAG TPA: hypothetical protein [Caudoviricetes sp.]
MSHHLADKIYSNLPLPVTGSTSICNVINLNKGKY